MKAIYKMNIDCGRMGDLEGVFIADTDEIKALIGKSIYFGEVLGKHSDIVITLTTSDVTEKSRDQAFIAKVEDIFGDGTISGFNPLDYYEHEEEE